MIRYVFGLFDKVANEYRTPIFAPSAAVVIRDLGDELRAPSQAGNVITGHPHDFCLHELGRWDSETGLFVDLQDNPRLIVELDVILDTAPVVPPGHNHQVGMP